MRIFIAVACMAAASWVASASAQSAGDAQDSPMVVACGGDAAGASGSGHVDNAGMHGGADGRIGDGSSGGGTTTGGPDASGASRGASRNAGSPEFESGAGLDGRIGTADDEDVAGDAPSRYGVGPDGIPGTADDEEHAPSKRPDTDNDTNDGRSKTGDGNMP